MSLYDLLPPNSTELERDFSRTTSSLQRAGQPVPRIRTAKRTDIPDSVVPWLIYEYGLSELLPYLTDLREALAEGVIWQRVRGTPQALKTALGWIGFNAALEESEAGSIRWADFQLSLDKPPRSTTFVDRVINISALSAPVRSRLFRIYGGYDLRRFKLDEHTLGDSLLCDHSGVYLRADWPQLSFGEVHPGAAGTLANQVQVLLTKKYPVQVFNLDRFLLDLGSLDTDWHTLNHPGVRGRLYSFDGGQLLGNPDPLIPTRKFSKAQVVPSDTWHFGDLNHCFPVAWRTEAGEAFFLDDFAVLSEQRLAEVWQEINERLENFTDADAAYLFDPLAGRNGAPVHSLRLPRIAAWDVLAGPQGQAQRMHKAEPITRQPWTSFDWLKKSWRAAAIETGLGGLTLITVSSLRPTDDFTHLLRTAGNTALADWPEAEILLLPDSQPLRTGESAYPGDASFMPWALTVLTHALSRPLDNEQSFNRLGLSATFAEWNFSEARGGEFSGYPQRTADSEWFGGWWADQAWGDYDWSLETFTSRTGRTVFTHDAAYGGLASLDPSRLAQQTAAADASPGQASFFLAGPFYPSQTVYDEKGWEDLNWPENHWSSTTFVSFAHGNTN